MAKPAGLDCALSRQVSSKVGSALSEGMIAHQVEVDAHLCRHLASRCWLAMQPVQYLLGRRQAVAVVRHELDVSALVAVPDNDPARGPQPIREDPAEIVLALVGHLLYQLDLAWPSRSASARMRTWNQM